MEMDKEQSFCVFLTKQTETLIFGRNFNEIVVLIAMGNCGC